MMIVVRILLLTFLVGSAHGQGASPQQLDLASIAEEYLPEIRAYDPMLDMASGDVREIDSPYYTSKILLAEEPDLAHEAAGVRVVRASVVMNGTPFMTFLIRQFQRFNVFWLDDEVFQISNWPDPCLELITIYSVLDRQVLYQTGFQYCGD